MVSPPQKTLSSPYEAVIDGMLDAVVAIDSDSRITLINPAAHLLLELPSGQLGRSLFEVIRAPALQELLNNDKESSAGEFDLAGGDKRVMAKVAHRRDGSRIIVLSDVTELRRLETVRRDFVANVSHELRTPISIVRANLETLIDGAMEDDHHGPLLAQAALRNAERLTNIINDLLDISRLEAGQYGVTLDKISLKKAIRSAVETINRKVRVKTEPKLKAFADAKALDQILINFLDNAAKYTPDDSDIEVWTMTSAEGTARIEVRDSGPGLDPRHRSRVFERFYRADPGRSREMGGTGLGLAIVKHLAEAMGGQVGVEANDPKGSIFWVELKAPIKTRLSSSEIGEEEEEEDEYTVSAPVAASSAVTPAKPSLDKEQYRSNLREVRDNLLRMTGHVEEMIEISTSALLDADIDRAKTIFEADNQVNRLEIETDELCLLLLASGPALSDDLRFITLAMKMVTDLERIGDLAVNIAERAIALNGIVPNESAPLIGRMSEVNQELLREATDAFIHENAERADDVRDRDEEVDRLYLQLCHDIEVAMREEPDLLGVGMHLQAVAKFLERIGDHITNLAEHVVFLVKGKDIRHAGSLAKND